MDPDLRELREALQDLGALMSGSVFHAALTREAGVSFDRALIQLLLRIESRGPNGVESLAKSIGRDQSTVSRQLAKLEQLGLVERKPSPKDARVREAFATKRGKAVVDMLEAANERLAPRAFAYWSRKEKRDFTHLLRKFVNETLVNLQQRRDREAASTLRRAGE